MMALGIMIMVVFASKTSVELPAFGKFDDGSAEYYVAEGKRKEKKKLFFVWA